LVKKLGKENLSFTWSYKREWCLYENDSCKFSDSDKAV